MIALFCTTEDIKRYSIIDGSVDEDKFLTDIEIAQELRIKPILGTKLYDRLQEGVINDDLTTDEATLLDNYVNKTIIFYANADYLPFSSFEIKNGGVFRHFSENSTPASKDDIDYLIKKTTSKAEYYRKELVKYLCNNASLYPEYSQNESGDIYPSKNSSYTGGWYFGSSRNFNWKVDD